MTALGIDAGGSGTKWALVDERGACLGAGRVAPLSGHLFDETSRLEVMGTLRALRGSLGSQAPQAVLAGVTGLTQGSEIAAWLEGTLLEVFGARRAAVMGDMDLAYRAHFEPGAGILVYAGTGSVAYHVADDGQVFRAGGRGYLIDDAGGGFWIGREALSWLTRRMDTGAKQDDGLSLQLLEHLGARDWDGIRAHVYAGGRSAVAALAPAVGRAATQGSLEALDILERAGRELGDLARRLGMRVGRLPVVLAGGALSVSPKILEAVKNDGLEFTVPTVDIALEAARMANRG